MADDDLAFLNLILLLGAMASRRLDGVARAGADERNERLHATRGTIDMLTSLKKRTAGRLSPEEDRVIDSVLRDLQSRYVRALASPPASSTGKTA
jgi:hypothetical protein